MLWAGQCQDLQRFGLCQALSQWLPKSLEGWLLKVVNIGPRNLTLWRGQTSPPNTRAMDKWPGHVLPCGMGLLGPHRGPGSVITGRSPRASDVRVEHSQSHPMHVSWSKQPQRPPGGACEVTHVPRLWDVLNERTLRSQATFFQQRA